MEKQKPWLERYDPGVPHTIDVNQYASIPDILEACFQKHANATCFTNFGEKLTFNEVDQLSQAFAVYLQNECGLVKGDRVAIMMANVMQYPIALMGILRAGMVNVNVNPLYTAQQAQSMLQETGAKCIVVLSNFSHIAEGIIAKTDVKCVIVTEIGDLFRFPKNIIFNFVIKYIKKMVPKWHIPGYIPFKKTIDKTYQQRFKKIYIGPDELAFLQFTEGRETGRSKCVMLTHRNIIANILQMSLWLSPGLEGKDKDNIGEISLFPFFKMAAFSTTGLPMMRFGLSNHLITNPRDIFSIIKQWKKQPIFVFSGIRTVFNELLYQEKFLNMDFSKLKFVFSGGMVISQALADRWATVTGVRILEAYALTEASPMVIVNPVSTSEFRGYIGLPLPSTDVKIADEKGNELLVGERGEFWIKGPQIMKGYWNNPEQTKAVLTEDGWFRTGDIGFMTSEGFFKLINRKEDLIKTKKGIVYPSEVEDIIAAISGVAEAVIVGGETESSESIVKAYVIRSDYTLTEEFIFSHCRRELHDYQVPQIIEFVSACLL